MNERVELIRLDRDAQNALYLRGILITRLDDDEADLFEAVREARARPDEATAFKAAERVRERRAAMAELAFPIGVHVRHRTAPDLGIGLVRPRECEDDECEHEGATDDDPQGGCDIGNCIGYVPVRWPSGGGGFYWPGALERVL